MLYYTSFLSHTALDETQPAAPSWPEGPELNQSSEVSPDFRAGETHHSNTTELT